MAHTSSGLGVQCARPGLGLTFHSGGAVVVRLVGRSLVRYGGATRSAVVCDALGLGLGARGLSLGETSGDADADTLGLGEVLGVPACVAETAVHAVALTAARTATDDQTRTRRDIRRETRRAGLCSAMVCSVLRGVCLARPLRVPLDDMARD